MFKKELKLRKKIIQTCLELENKGLIHLIQAKTDNISHHWKEDMLITHSGIEYKKLTKDVFKFNFID